jgi:uncharacterized damage-inducible protein DinB
MPPVPMLDDQQFLAFYLGHRRLTRKTLAAFPADQFESFSIGGMRAVGVIARELVSMGAPVITGLATDAWGTWSDDRSPLTQDAALAAWDEATPVIEQHWPAVVARGFDRNTTLYGQWPGTTRTHLLYLLDNETHHRGQLYAYLRALGIEPPAFWER